MDTAAHFAAAYQKVLHSHALMRQARCRAGTCNGEVPHRLWITETGVGWGGTALGTQLHALVLLVLAVIVPLCMHILRLHVRTLPVKAHRTCVRACPPRPCACPRHSRSMHDPKPDTFKCRLLCNNACVVTSTSTIRSCSAV